MQWSPVLKLSIQKTQMKALHNWENALFFKILDLFKFL